MAVYSIGFLDMQKAVYGGLGEVYENNTGFFTIDEVKRWLNWAQLKIASRAGCYVRFENPSLVAGQNYYTLPPGFNGAKKIVFQGTPKRELVWVSPESFLERLASSGAPQYYSVFSGYLWLWPTPADTSKIYHLYKAVPQQLVNDSDVTFDGDSLWTPYQVDVVALAIRCGRAKKADKDPETAADGFENRFKEIAKELSSKSIPSVIDNRNQVKAYNAWDLNFV